jgi:hypothetical protein
MTRDVYTVESLCCRYVDGLPPVIRYEVTLFCCKFTSAIGSQPNNTHEQPNNTREQRQVNKIIYQFYMNVRRVFLRVGRIRLRRLCVQRSQGYNQEYGEVSEIEVMKSWTY